MPRPLVSVVVPTYNGVEVLREALDSAFAQTFDDHEVVVVNDGSTDGTSAYLRALGDRIRLVEQENRGIGAARNAGLERSIGKYVAFLDHDDVWRPGKLEAQVRFMEAHPECVACSVRWARSTDPLRCAFDVAALGLRDGLVERPLLELARGQPFLISSALLVERRAAAGLRYETRRQCIEDDPFQVKLFARGPFGIAGEEILMIYRMHEENSSARASHFYNGVRLLRAMQRRGAFSDLSPVHARDLERFLSSLGRTAAVRQLLGGYRARALELYLREAFHQARDGRVRFLAAFPLLATLPASVLRLRWRGVVR